MPQCKLEVFPKHDLVIYVGKLVAFSVILSILAASFSAGFTDPLNLTATESDGFARGLEAAGNFVPVAVLGMILFIFPFSLGGMGFGYLIEGNPHVKVRTAAIGYVAGAVIGFAVLSAVFVVPFASPASVAAVLGAIAGFAGGIVLGSTTFGMRNSF
jgi:hypothetical protein